MISRDDSFAAYRQGKITFSTLFDHINYGSLSKFIIERLPIFSVEKLVTSEAASNVVHITTALLAFYPKRRRTHVVGIHTAAMISFQTNTNPPIIPPSTRMASPCETKLAMEPPGMIQKNILWIPNGMPQSIQSQR